jgi:hypothetical protein
MFVIPDDRTFCTYEYTMSLPYVRHSIRRKRLPSNAYMGSGADPQFGRFSENPAQWIFQQLQKRDEIEARLLDQSRGYTFERGCILST